MHANTSLPGGLVCIQHPLMQKIQCVTNCMYVAIWPSMIAMLKTSITDVQMNTTSSYHNDELK